MAGLRNTALALLAVAALGSFTHAAGPTFWEVSKQDEVARGDARGVSIAENGAISLAPQFALVYDTKEAYIWSSATDRAGNVYLGTGHEGRIFKVTPNGAGSLLYDSPELDVMALATDPQGNLYAGTGPDGKIYKIAPDGARSVFYDPADKYIWSLVYDPATSTLYAGTGDKGVIYRIDPAGKAAVLTDTTEANIVSLALDEAGNLLAGTDPSGLVLRIGKDGKAFALFDSPMQEIHSLVPAGGGAVYALGVNQQASGAQRGSSVGTSTTTSVSSEGVITISASDDDSPGSGGTVDYSALNRQPVKSKADGSKAALFRVQADSSHDVLWTSKEAVGFGLRPLPDKHVLIGTNQKGRIYSVAPDGANTLLIQSPEDQTSTLLAVGDALYATSSNLGRLYRLSRQTASEGTYVSSIHDTRFAGQWGIINWRGAGTVEVQTRTGNTERPDATWSDWSAPYKNPGGDQITSPRARFIQWRAKLRGGATPAARLQSVTVAYLPRNQAPEVTSVSVLPPGVALQETPLLIDPSIASSGLDPQLFGVTTAVPPRRYYQKGSRTLTWQGSDPNGDALEYRVSYRTIGDNEWHPLTEGLTQTYYTIDGNRLPDGTYHFRVQASDRAGNPAELALTHETVTEAVEVDNTPPAIKTSGPTVSGPAVEVVFEVNDVTSRVIRGEYSVDGGPWQLIYPADGIADSNRETYRVKVTFDKPGEHVIAFRCTDSSSNVGTSKVTATR